jgi:hypothetical protein
MHKYNFILKQKRDERVRIGFIWHRMGIRDDTCEQDNNPSSSIMGGKFMTT